MSSSNEVSGICAAVTLKPFFCRRGMTLLHDDPSAHAPCTSTTLVLVSIFFSLDYFGRSRSFGTQPLMQGEQLRSVTPYLAKLVPNIGALLLDCSSVASS